MEQGCSNSVANRTYYAVFHAARAALVAAGVSAVDQRWSHEGVQAAFSRLIHRRKLYPSALRDALSNLIATRELADYHWEMIGSRTAQKALRMAEEFVSRVEMGIRDDQEAATKQDAEAPA